MNSWNLKFLSFAVILTIGTSKAFAGAGIATAHSLATEAGISMLQMGGNAFDAAVAISSTLAVVEPGSSGMGGGGFWLLYDAAKQQSIMLDGREKAPLKASRDMYLNDQGDVIARLSIDGPLAAGIPGQPAALVWLAENYGSLPLSVSLKPSINAAKRGFEVNDRFQRKIKWRKAQLENYPSTAEIFLRGGEIPKVGELIVQEDLANVLQALAERGHDGFYSGPVAEALVKGVQEADGIWTIEDFNQYEVAVRVPVTFLYRNMKITSAALPSSGGIVLAEVLNILENYDISTLDEADHIHVVVEATRRAYRDRAEYMGDPDFVSVPVEMLISKSYASGLSQSIRMDTATKSDELAPITVITGEGGNTTHFSVIDSDNNMVAATLSINHLFGSGFIPPNTGVLLNNEMDDFSLRPGSPNSYGLIGSDANSIEAGKRMLSSMTPTFIEDDQRIAILGAPGGSRIITMVLLGILEFEKGKDAKSIVGRPRFHHQYLPDEIQFEKNAPDEDVRSALKSRGHRYKISPTTWGNMQIVILEKSSGTVTAASDPRGEGTSWQVN